MNMVNRGLLQLSKVVAALCAAVLVASCASSGLYQMSDQWCKAHPEANEKRCAAQALSKATNYCQYGEHPNDPNCPVVDQHNIPHAGDKMTVVGATAQGNALAVDLTSIQDEPTEAAVSAVIATLYQHNESINRQRLFMATGRFFTHCRKQDAKLPTTWYGLDPHLKVIIQHSNPQEYMMLDDSTPLMAASELVCNTAHPGTAKTTTISYVR